MTDATVWKFPPKTQLQLKERVKAIAWATNKVGGWRGPNVTASIQRYLQDSGYKTTQALVKLGMDYLVKHELAVAVVLGRRTTEFILVGDVELEEPDFIRAARLRATSHGPAPEPIELPAPASNGAAVIDDHGSRPIPGVEVLPGRGRKMPRLPSAVASGPSGLDLLADAVRTWHRTDPDAAELWVDAVLRDLGVAR
jgi:hypothetical protein